MSAARVETPVDFPMVIAPIVAASVERLSPTFVRVEFAGEALADLGVDGPWYDQRVKLVFPHGDGPVPTFCLDDSWYTAWRALPLEQRGHMRTYTVRDVTGYGVDTRLVVDFVVHDDGHAGPGAGWAQRASTGDALVLIGPRRGVAWGGIEFTPGEASSLLLVGDESAVPAVAGILAGLGCDARGRVYLEVPSSADVQDLPRPPGVEVCWLPRGHDEVGCRLVPEVRAYVGLPPPPADDEEVGDIEPTLWETPVWSSSGEPVDGAVQPALLGHELAGVFCWIAGESAMVTRLRRALVRELGVDRRQVAFMGYWRRGVAMAS